MPTSFLPYEPNQTFLLPPSPSEWLAEDHLVYFVSEIIDRLDLGKFYARYDGDGRRNQPYDPALLVKVLVYGYATRVFCSRQLARKLYEDVGFRVLGAGNFPSHRTISEFRVKHLPELKELFVGVAQLAREIGMVKLGTVALDGTKVKAQASKHKAMSYGRMKEQEQRLKEEIEALLEGARRTDAQEDAQWGAEQGEGQLPQDLKRRQDRLAKIQAAKARLQQRQAQADREQGRHPDDQQRRGDGAGRPFKREFGEPEDKAQDNFTDPQSRIMKLGGSFEQCYNAQAVVDGDSQLIVAIGLGNNAADNEQLVPMVEAVKENFAVLPQRVLGDAGFRSEDGFAKLEAEKYAGMEVLVALGREGKKPTAMDPKKYPATVRMAERLASKEGQAHYRRRKAIVEPVFGWIKHAMGFRQFSLRGLDKVAGEWGLVCLALNLRRMWVLQG